MLLHVLLLDLEGAPELAGSLLFSFLPSHNHVFCHNPPHLPGWHPTAAMAPAEMDVTDPTAAAVLTCGTSGRENLQHPLLMKRLNLWRTDPLL
jgi:hypothetical protein